MNQKISIFIPTYNRSGNLENLLKSLEEKNTLNVNILDNNSTDKTEDIVSSFIEKDLPFELKYYKNVANIGLSANLLRCIEYCETEWLWILGDDDTPYKSYAEVFPIYLDEPDSANTCFINFSTTSMQLREKDIVSFGLEDFLLKMDSYSNTLFISTSLFNVRLLKQYIRLGYNYIYSLAPHLVTLFSALNDNKYKAIFSRHKIVDFGDVSDGSQKWSYFNLYLGVMTLLEIPNLYSSVAYKNLCNKISEHIIVDYRLFYAIIEYYHDKPVIRKYLFNQIILRNFSYVPRKQFPNLFKLIVYTLLINNDYLLNKFVKYKKSNLQNIGSANNIQPLNNRL